MTPSISETFFGWCLDQGRIQDFKLGGGGGGGALKNNPPRGRRENFGGISCEKSRFTPKNIFFPMAEGGGKSFGVFRVKNHNFTPKNHIFSNFRGVRPPPPPWIRPCRLADEYEWTRKWGTSFVGGPEKVARF